MHLPTKGVPLRGALLFLVSRLSAIPALRRVLIATLLKETRIRELPEKW